MASLNLVTGYQGVNHVTAPQWADLNRGIIGDAAILPVGSEMQPTIQTANQITVPDGVVVYDGREFYIGYGESVNLAIASGTQGMLRNDIVVVEYNRDESSGVESDQFQVIEGTPATSNPQDPAYSDQDIRTGVFTSQKPFCRVVINGTSIQEIQMLVDVIENMKDMEENIGDLEQLSTSNKQSLVGAVNEVDSDLKNNFNQNQISLTNSTYYPTSYMYRSGQTVYLRCAGLPLKEIPANSEFVIATEIPDEYKPIVDLIFYEIATIDGIVVRVSISKDGEVTINPPVTLSVSSGLNIHVFYMTGKSNFS